MSEPHTTTAAFTRRARWWWLLALGAVLATVWGMWRALEQRQARQAALQASTQQAPAILAIPAQEWLQVQTRTLTVGVPITGSLAAVDRAVVKARVPGELRELHVREGDAVVQGQVIARVDATESEARFRQAKLQADAAQAQVAIAQRQYDNNRALVARGFISDTALTTSLANLQAAQASHAAARAAQDGARKNLDDTVLRSPIAGQIAQRMVQNGERVNVEAAVVEVVNLAALELQAQVAANDTAQVQVGQTARLQLSGHSAAMPQPLQAQVVRINPSAAAGSRTVPVYLRLQPRSDLNLRPGMYVEGFIQTGQHQALAVPLDAVRTDQPLPYVHSVAQGQVQHTPVVLGVQSVDSARPWVAVEGLPEGTIVLGGRVGGIPAGTSVQLEAQHPSTAAAAAAAAH